MEIFLLQLEDIILVPIILRSKGKAGPLSQCHSGHFKLKVEESVRMVNMVRFFMFGPASNQPKLTLANIIKKGFITGRITGFPHKVRAS